MDLATVQASDFEPHVEQTFQVQAVGLDQPLAFVLTAVEASRHRGVRPGSRAPFSLWFTGPAEPLLPQGSYRFEHTSTGAFEIFIVPNSRKEDGRVVYQVVFN